jgi:hypothetical protein
MIDRIKMDDWSIFCLKLVRKFCIV